MAKKNKERIPPIIGGPIFLGIALIFAFNGNLILSLIFGIIAGYLLLEASIELYREWKKLSYYY
ncbi:MAG: hypothetical protein ACP5G1_04375 [Nanopusillaceae archaeon]